MERLARVADLWNWLPAFRAVAETENVHDAARSLGVSPSSLSRTIGLLESRLERPLFERTGRAMHLTQLGRDLLGVVRDAMRIVDDVTAANGEILRVAAPCDLATTFVLPLLRDLRDAGRAVGTRIHGDPDVDPLGRLLRGELDLVLGCDRVIERRIIHEQVGVAHVGLYVSARQPHDGPMDTLADALRWPFVTYRAPGGVPDHWPEGLQRTIAMEVQDPRDAAQSIAEGGLVGLLPDELVRMLAPPLRRLSLEPFPPVPVFAMRRRSLGRPHVADELVAAIQARADVAGPGLPGKDPSPIL